MIYALSECDGANKHPLSGEGSLSKGRGGEESLVDQPVRREEDATLFVCFLGQRFLPWEMNRADLQQTLFKR